MLTYPSLDAIPATEFTRGTAVAIGKFDGVHLGHRALLEQVIGVAERDGLESAVFTFTNNPLSFLRPELHQLPIMSSAQRLEAIAEAGIEACVMVPFDAALAAVTAEQFVKQVLLDLMKAKHLCLGADFRFGNRGAGDAALLVRLGNELGFTVEVIGQVEDEDHGRVSSSRIREAILEGDVVSAGRMLGRPVSVRGRVVSGDRRGRELGFPTANLGGDVEGLVPAEGVYAGWATVRGNRYQAAISVGVNLTFDPAGEPRVEAHLLDFTGDLYEAAIEISFARRIRGMVAFAGADALIECMHEDVRMTRDILAGG